MVRLLKIFFLILALACATPQSEKPQPEQIENIVVKDTMTVIFSGDMMQHLPQVTRAATPDGGFDYSKVFRSITKWWKQSDYVVVNLETTLSDSAPYTGYPMFRSPSALLDALKEAGVTTLALANNHCVDRGLKGVRNTIEAINQRGFDYVGMSDTTVRQNIAWLKKGSHKVALLNYTYGTNGMPIPESVAVNLIDTTQIRADYQMARDEEATAIVIFFHWGEEYQLQPNSQQKELALWCRELGADWVIGAHPHVVQPIDLNHRVVYSLGNLCSNQYFPYTQGGINVILSFYNDRPSDLRCFPHWVDREAGYGILMCQDTLSHKSREFRQSIKDTYQIINSRVRYDQR
ncbi:MAG: CapA family protein [Rikenellaceae bacterium]